MSNKLSELTPEQVLQLRSEVTLNSLYTSDYNNRLGVDPGEACSFFEGYCEYLEELGEGESDKNLLAWFACWNG